MRTNTRLIIAYSLAGWITLCCLNACSRRRLRRMEHRQMTRQIDTWEGEGGNGSPPAQSSARSSGPANG